MRIENLLRKFLFGLLTVFWIKMAYDLLFAFGPESARLWFGFHVVVLMAVFGALLASLNLYSLNLGQGCHAANSLTKPHKAIIIFAFLSSIFACLATEPTMKFLDMFIIIPAIIILLVLSSESSFEKPFRRALLGLSVLLLIPSDSCENPQNWWWINNGGLAPLTYAMPVNIMLYFTSEKRNSKLDKAVYVVVFAYFLASIYHRWSGEY